MSRYDPILDDFEEDSEVIDWDWLDKQPRWFQNEVRKGKKKPKYKKRIRKEKRDAEKKYRN